MRLIDADDFFERMKNDTDLCAEMEMYGEEALKRYLDLQPTAYDVDKVVEELYEYIAKIVGRKSALYQTIMKIVKRGGKHDI